MQGAHSTVKYLGGIEKDTSISLPDRHLGLVPAEEIFDLDCKLNQAANAIEKAGLTDLPPKVRFQPAQLDQPAKLLTGTTVGIARDQAFSFLYKDNLHLLVEMGANVVFFSLLDDEQVPYADSLYLPGGYPELHLPALEANESMKAALHEHYRSGKPIYAECGGMLYLLNQLTDKNGASGNMAGLILGNAVMQNKLAALGYQSVQTPHGPLRGHTFHHSKTSLAQNPSDFAKRRTDGGQGEPIVRQNGIHASYVHLYFRSNPAAAASFFKNPPDLR
jgi:cobyrinic acid a,c-diamide synthase